MVPIKPNSEPTVRDQLKKFILKSGLGFQTVLVHDLGTRLGIFDYLYEKGKALSASGEVDSITFTLDELAQKLQLNHRHLDAWLHMAIICGIFEIDESCDRCLKTAPHVYDILVNRESMFYMGGTISLFYVGSKIQEIMEEGFKTGELMPFMSLIKNYQRILDWLRVDLLLLHLKLNHYFRNISKITNGFYVKGDFC